MIQMKFDDNETLETILVTPTWQVRPQAVLPPLLDQRAKQQMTEPDDTNRTFDDNETLEIILVIPTWQVRPQAVRTHSLMYLIRPSQL